MDSLGIYPEKSLSMLRRELFGQKGHVYWIFGRSGSGKSTIARTFDEHLLRRGKKTVWLDGDSFRRGVSKDLGFSESAREENLRRAAEVAKMLVESELVVLCSFITPLKSHRDLVRSILGEHCSLIFVDASLETCQQRDPKGLYLQSQTMTKAKTNNIEMFEIPTQEENDILKLDNGGRFSLQEGIAQIIRHFPH